MYLYLFPFIVAEAPKTMSPEWREATRKRYREAKANPIFGLSSDENMEK
jgi:hypothetical protein